MKIVNIILTSVNGGAEKVFLDYCQVLKERLGHDVYAIILENAPYGEKLDEIGVKYKRITNKFGYYDPFAVNSIKEALIEFDAKATISHTGKASILVRKAIKKSKKAICEICVNHSNNVKRSIGANMVICVNKNIFYQVIDRGQKPENTVILHNAIEIDEIQDKFNPDLISFDKKEIVLGMMARLDSYKGHLKILSSLRELNQNSDKIFKLKIAGTGDFQSKIAQEVENLNLESQVEFCGWIQNKKEFFNTIDLFLFPSDSETFGLVLIEAISNSTPTISSNTDGAKEIIHPNKDGIMVDLDPSETFSTRICDAVIELSKDEKKAKEMAKNAHEKLLKRFSFDNLEMNLKDLFGRK